MNTIEMDKEYVAGTYNRFPIEIVSGKGSVVKSSDGKEYIDMGSGIAVTSFGIADDEWQDAIVSQISKVQHMSNLFYTQPCAELAKILCERTGMKKVFFSNSGAEANECAIKVARKYAAEKKGAEYSTIITIKNGFHGRTLTTLAATGQEHYHELYQPLTPGFVSIDKDVESLKKAVKENKVAGIMIELVQGEGGVIQLENDFVDEIAKVAKDEDIVLIVDEVQTGNGRTGYLYSYMAYGLQPDVVSTAKGLAGGLPLGATMLGDKVKDVFGFGDHGSTFGGNPVCCAAAISIINRIDDKLMEDVKKKGEFLKKTFEACDGVEYVTGMGLMVGLKTKKPASEVLNACMANGVLCLTAKDKVRIMPALNIPMDVLEKAVKIISDCL